ncbi:MAG: FlgO family outer membrane protein, partial [Chthoniobacterales bacterium]
MAPFFAELKRRNVYKVAVAYAVVAWLLIQIATQVFPFFAIPNWAVRLVVVLLLLGFPVALLLAWAYELTPQGIKRTEEVAPQESIRRRTGRKLDFFIISVLLVVIALLVTDRFRRRGPPGARIPEKSIAVLPFANLSDDKQNAYLADGIMDEIITDLVKVADLRVISRTSVMQYSSDGQRNLRNIAAELGVAHVLEGSVQRVGRQVRVNAQLIDARTDAHKWAQGYDRDVADIFAVESELAQAIVAQLRAKLSPEEKTAIAYQPTSDLEAFELYTQARDLLATSVMTE